MIHEWTKHYHRKRLFGDSVTVPYPIKTSDDEIILASREPPEIAKQKVEEAQKEAELALKLFNEKHHAVQRLLELYRVSSCLDEIYKGVPIKLRWLNKNEGQEAVYLEPVLSGRRENPRYARIYRNRHNNTTWGLALIKIRPHAPGSDDKFMGAKYASFDECKTIALNWIACGTTSSES